MTAITLELDVLHGAFACARLGPGEPVPAWATDTELCSVTRTAHELSIICPAAQVPDAVRSEGPLRAYALRGPLDFGAVGTLAALAAPLAAAGIPILTISTFDTDLLLVSQDDDQRARDTLTQAGYAFPDAQPRRVG